MEQHFLTNPEKLEALVAAAGINPTDRVLELGSGGGTVAAVLPPCRLMLVELDRELADRLRIRFSRATVISGDALTTLEAVEADIISSNLPHTLTRAVLEKLGHKTFRRALIAVHGQDALNFSNVESLRLEPLLTLFEHDFTPPQPFRSKLVLVTPRYPE